MSNIDSKKRDVLKKALVNVPFDGWSNTVLKRAVIEAGLKPEYAEILFPSGTVALVDFFISEADRLMLEGLEKLPLADMRVHERVRAAIRLRLEQNMPYRSAIQKAIAFYALPNHTKAASESLWRTTDAIWIIAGDTSTDMNYYSKRTLLIGVYSSTLLYWLDDDSEGLKNTFAFLDRRLGDVLKINKFKALGNKLLPAIQKIPFLRLLTLPH